MLQEYSSFLCYVSSSLTFLQYTLSSKAHWYGSFRKKVNINVFLICDELGDTGGLHNAAVGMRKRACQRGEANAKQDWMRLIWDSVKKAQEKGEMYCTRAKWEVVKVSWYLIAYFS